MKKTELLAPAGNFEALKAAIASGADAVYLGGKTHNARMSANNFDIEEIRQAIAYAKLRRVRVYITMNTLLRDSEMESAVRFAKQMEDMGADAIILQDIGLAYLLSQETRIPLHASTQCGVHNIAGALAMEEVGFDRVILAREMSIDRIKAISKNTKIELEAFVHGAMCSSFSGECYLSWEKGGRSGNCGACAQPCRLPSKNGYPLSTRDLCAIELLPELVNAGLSSLKIEGRSKRPEYVSIVTACYREALDLTLAGRIYSVSKYDKFLQSIYNRGGFTKGYYGNGNDIYGATTPNHRGVLIGQVEKVTPTKVQAKVTEKLRVYDGLSFGDKGIGMEISDLYFQNVRVHEAKGKVEFSSILKGVEAGDDIYRTTDYLQMQWAKNNTEEFHFIRWIQGECQIDLQKVRLKLTCDSVSVTHDLGVLPEFAKNKTITRADVQKALDKTGDTVFKFDDLDIRVQSGLFLSVRDLNRLRREALTKLEEALLKSPERRNKTKLVEARQPVDFPKSVYIGTKAKGEVNLLRAKQFDQKAFHTMDGVVLPHITYDDDLEKISNLVHTDATIVCNNIGQIQELKGKCKVWAGFGCNIINKYAARAYRMLGAQILFQSFEEEAPVDGCLQLKQGKVGLMHFTTCPKNARVSCKECDHQIAGMEIDCQTVVNRTATLYGKINRNNGQINIGE